MEQVNFDGNGQPKDDLTKDGDVLILVQGRSARVVRLTIQPPDMHGPELDDAENNAELEQEVFRVVARANPRYLKGDRHYTLRCPMEIARRAKFPTNA